MSAALITQLRENCDYLRDHGHHQTAQLMASAADEIERLHRERQAVEATTNYLPPLRRPVRAIRRLARIGVDEVLPSGTVPRGNRT